MSPISPRCSTPISGSPQILGPAFLEFPIPFPDSCWSLFLYPLDPGGFFSPFPRFLGLPHTHPVLNPDFLDSLDSHPRFLEFPILYPDFLVSVPGSQHDLVGGVPRFSTPIPGIPHQSVLNPDFSIFAFTTPIADFLLSPNFNISLRFLIFPDSSSAYMYIFNKKKF